MKMTHVQRLKRFQRVNQHLTAHPDVWSGNPYIVKSVAGFRTCIQGLEEVLQVQAIGSKNRTRLKKQQKMKTVAAVERVASAVRVWARMNGDESLANRLQKSVFSNLKRSFPEFVNALKAVLKIAEECLPQIQDHCLTSGDQQAANDQIALLEKEEFTFVDFNGMRKDASEWARLLNIEATAHQKTMDDLIPQCLGADRAFLRIYRERRGLKRYVRKRKRTGKASASDPAQAPAMDVKIELGDQGSEVARIA